MHAISYVGPAVRQDAARQGGLRGHQVLHPPADGHEEGVREELHQSQEEEQRMMLLKISRFHDFVRFTIKYKLFPKLPLDGRL